MMKSPEMPTGIRPNTLGDWPKIDSTSFVDPSAQVMGNVVIGPRVYVGPQSVIRADEVDEEGHVHPVVIEEESYVQDGVIIHARAGTEVIIGAGSNIAHGVIIHGPCMIGKNCFIALRSAIYNSTLEDEVWVGIGAILMRTTIPSHTMIPAGSVVRSSSDVRQFRVTNVKEDDYRQKVYDATTKLREGYLGMYRKGVPERPKE
jgi:carbonic anhydrase/acetyltransferase-like protein (isoleucine patch superfamily)